MRRVLAAVALLAAGACGGAPEPETAADAADASEDAAAESAPDDVADPREDAETEAAVPATAEDIQAVLQLVLDDESLQPHLGLEKTGRFPFKVAGDGIPKDLELTKNAEAVKIVDVPSDKAAAVLVVTELEISGTQASVTYRYDIEKLRGTASLEKGEYGWELATSNVVKR